MVVGAVVVGGSAGQCEPEMATDGSCVGPAEPMMVAAHTTGRLSRMSAGMPVTWKVRSTTMLPHTS